MTKAVYELKVSKDYHDKTIKELLTNYGFSAKNQYLVELNNGLFLNKERATRFFHLKEGDRLGLDFSSFKRHGIKPYQKPIEIVYEDESVLIVNKGNKTLIYDDNNDQALINQVEFYRQSQGYYYELLPVHRIDKDTTGMVVFGKNPLVVSYLSKRFEEKEVSKIYVALVHHPFNTKDGVIDHPIASDRHNNKERVSHTGKKATSLYKVITSSETSRVEINIIGGRKHQIRVHMAYIGHPVVGDRLYSKDKEGPMYLHFYKIGFKHPNNLEPIEITCEPGF